MNDKLLHFAAGFVTSIVGAICWHFSAVELALLPWFALLASCVAGITKEAADWMNNRLRPGSHSVEGLDFFATLAGGIPIAILGAL